MDRDELPTRADVEAMKRWTRLSGDIPGADSATAYGDGRIVLPAPVEEAAREAEESARAREERHAEGRARIVRAIGGALGMSHAVGAGPWASLMRGRPSSSGTEGADAGKGGSD